jgi:hypothetical protein
MKLHYVQIADSTDSHMLNNQSDITSYLSIFRANLLKITIFLISTLITTLIISIGLVVSTEISGYNRQTLNSPVDKENCDCDCWDGFYRGQHPRRSQNTMYKPFYFNYDKQIITILFIFLFYAQLLKEILVKLIRLLAQKCNNYFYYRSLKCELVQDYDKFNKSKDINYSNESLKFNNIRYGCLINLIICSYSNYYGIWSIINYLNDRDYRMIRSQLFFSITELIPSYVYFEYLDRYDLNFSTYKPINLSVIYPVFFISFLHIYLAVFEKILWGFFTSMHKDANRNKIRDLFLVLNDICAILFSLYHLIKIRRKNLSNGYIYKSYFKFWILFTLFLYTFYVMICSFEK